MNRSIACIALAFLTMAAPVSAQSDTPTFRQHISGSTLILGGSGTAQPDSCISLVNGDTVADGASFTAYMTASVPHGSTCQPQSVSCNNGTLSSTAAQGTCTVAQPLNCAAAWVSPGYEISHGSSQQAFLESSAAYGSTCLSQQRTCTDGSLSGSYTAVSCSVSAPASCTTDWGATVAHGQSFTVYQTETVPYGSTCNSDVRTCNDGTANGTKAGAFQYQQCTVDAPEVPDAPPAQFTPGESDLMTWLTGHYGASKASYVAQTAYHFGSELDMTFGFGPRFDMVATYNRFGSQTRFTDYLGDYDSVSGPAPRFQPMLGNWDRQRCEDALNFALAYKPADWKLTYNDGNQGVHSNLTPTTILQVCKIETLAPLVQWSAM